MLRPRLDRRVSGSPKSLEMSAYRPWIGALLTLALVTSIGAQCLIGQDITAAQMACCAGTDHDCQSVDAEDCCVGSDAQSQPPADRIQSVTPTLVAISPTFATTPNDVAVAAERLVHDPEHAGRFEGSPPVYIRLGTLLI